MCWRNLFGKLAYRIIKQGLIEQVSMECEATGECSICHHQVVALDDVCFHLQFLKGQFFNGKRVYKILHDVDFTGVALLTKVGADEKAKITWVK